MPFVSTNSALVVYILHIWRKVFYSIQFSHSWILFLLCMYVTYLHNTCIIYIFYMYISSAKRVLSLTQATTSCVRGQWSTAARISHGVHTDMSSEGWGSICTPVNRRGSSSRAQCGGLLWWGSSGNPCMSSQAGFPSTWGAFTLTPPEPLLLQGWSPD